MIGAGDHVEEITQLRYDLFLVGNAPLPQKLDKGIGLFYFLVLGTVNIPPDAMRALGVVVEFGRSDVLGHGVMDYFSISMSLKRNTIL